MKAKIIKFSDIAKHPRKSLSAKDYIKEKHTCGDCNTLYITEVMMCYRKPNYAYHNDKGTWFCIKCYNKRFQ